MRKIKQTVDRIAPTDMTVLVTGESGTGKEEVARLLHQQSRRAATQLTAINCAALPAELIESELFGHERGAFTGASARRIGRLEAADGSTLLLDEIGEMPLALQAKLLRFLQEREIHRVGSNRAIKLDVRIVAATNRPLSEEVGGGRFRADLYYRLQSCLIEVPPLRQRREDIRILVPHFAAKFAAEHQPQFADDALEVFRRHAWPGNVRELANAVEYAVNVCASGVVTVDDLPQHLTRREPAQEVGHGENETDVSQSIRLRLPALTNTGQWASGAHRIRSERLAIARRALSECGGNVTRAAKELGISRQRLHRVLKEGGGRP